MTTEEATQIWPKTVLLRVFSFLAANDLARIERVSRQWRMTITSADDLWRTLWSNFFRRNVKILPLGEEERANCLKERFSATSEESLWKRIYVNDCAKIRTSEIVPFPKWESRAIPSELRVVVMGKASVGKTSLVTRFIMDQFDTAYDPTLEDKYLKLLHINSQPIRLHIIDTAGSEEFKALRDQYMRNADLLLVVYSVTDPSTFTAILDFVERCKRVKEAEELLSLPLLLVGNKCDLPRKVSLYEGAVLASSFGCSFFEASAATGQNVIPIFEESVRTFVRATNWKPALSHKRVNTISQTGGSIPENNGSSISTPSNSNQQQSAAAAAAKRLSDPNPGGMSTTLPQIIVQPVGPGGKACLIQ